jgi:hypothetical protein
VARSQVGVVSWGEGQHAKFEVTEGESVGWVVGETDQKYEITRLRSSLGKGEEDGGHCVAVS